MKFALVPAIAMALLTYCSPGDGRQSNDTGMANDTSGGMSSADTAPSAAPAPASDSAEAPTTPAAILSQMNVANTMEIQLSKMAAEKAASPAVKKVASKLATDHSKNRQQVRTLAQKLKVPLTPAAGGDVAAADSAAMPGDLQGKSGAEFDRAFVEHEIRDHESNIQKIQTQLLPATQDPQVKSYLQKTLTDIQGHLESLKQAEQQLSS